VDGRLIIAALLIAAVFAAFPKDPSGHYSRTHCKCNTFLANCDKYFDRAYDATYTAPNHLTLKPSDTSKGTATGTVNSDGSQIDLQLSGVGSCRANPGWVDGSRSVQLKCSHQVFTSIKCDVTFHCDSGNCTK